MIRKLFTGLAAMATLAVAPGITPALAEQAGSAHDHAFIGIDGTPMPLAQFRGKALLIVNVASFCGFTKQYQGLQAIYQRYERDGLIVIGVPANDFGEQEPGTAEEIKSFCEGAFGVTFPLTQKSVVSGPGAHPFYAWAATAAPAGGTPKWNFHKYLVWRDGLLVGAFGTTIRPDAPEVTKAIEAALARPTGAKQ
jgi:glutathione peroxidase